MEFNRRVIMKLWIARDRSGLWLYITKPLFDPDRKEFESEDGNILYIDDELYIKTQNLQIVK